MKIVFDALQAGNRSGTGRYTEELAKRLPGLASDVDVIVESQGVKIPGYPTKSSRHGVRRVVYEQFGLSRLAREMGAAGVHYPANIGTAFRRSPSVVTVHDLSFFRDPSWFVVSRAIYYRAAVGRGALNATRLIADSQATADDIMKYLGVHALKIDVIPLGVDPQFRPASADCSQAVRAKYGLPARFFLYLGTLEPRKNLPRLIEAWSRIAKEADIDLVIAGRNGWKFAPIHLAIRKSPASTRIHCPGFVAPDDLPGLLSAATAFVWPSLCEGFGLPVLEAMACGTPVLSSNTSSIPEVTGDAALLVDPMDVDAIARGMLRLVRDEKLHDRLRAAGPEQARPFTWERTASMTLDTYRRAFP